MPSGHNYIRNLRQERLTAIARGETSSGSSSSDAKRHRARRAMEKKLGHKLPPTIDVDRKKPIKSGGSSELANLRLRNPSDNRSDGGKIGDTKGKRKGAIKGHKSRLPVNKP